MLNAIAQEIVSHGLMIMGHTADPDDPTRCIVLIGADNTFWPIFIQSPENSDGLKNPIDRWSKRIIGGVADGRGAGLFFPSDGPPYAPFISWAQATGRFWQSPTGMLVHDRAGLMISIRGAIVLEWTSVAIPVSQSPCSTCLDRPCINACPVDALSDIHFYDVPTCKAHITSDQGSRCMTLGCATRVACPLSQSFNRPSEQSAFHMRAFKG